MSTDRIEKTLVLRASVSRVWEAISDAEAFGCWFGIRFDGPFVVGATVGGQITIPGYEHLRGDFVIEAIEPERRIAWRSPPGGLEEGVDAASAPTTRTEITIEPHPDGTRLTLTESGFDAIPPEVRETLFRGNSEGWDHQLGNVKRYVEA